MTIREYFNTHFNDIDEQIDAENNAWALCEADDGSFEIWAENEGIDLSARDARTGEYVSTLWAWDMCGD